MKKIMFSDAYKLTAAVLSGRKTQTRRIIPVKVLSCCDLTENPPSFEAEEGFWIDVRMAKCAYQIGEIVAVAQSYKSLFEEDCRRVKEGKPMRNITIKNVSDHPGWTNKMFVRADLMPHQIRITNVRVERLNDISEADCLVEGIEKVKECEDLYRIPIFHKSGRITYIHGSSPRAVYAALIDRISGRGVWESNPFVFVYDFERL